MRIYDIDTEQIKLTFNSSDLCWKHWKRKRSEEGRAESRWLVSSVNA